MNKQKGLSLIELIVFIAILGVAFSASNLAYLNLLGKSATPGQNLKAAQLVMSYMTLINVHRQETAPATPADPCQANSIPTACQSLLDYASTEGITLTPTFSTSNNQMTITVTASGNGVATVKARFPV